MGKINFKTLAVCVLIPLAVGGLSALLTMNSMDQFSKLDKPPLSPPGWLFPVAWTILYILMGVASYAVVRTPKTAEEGRTALKPYFIQLAFNFFWSIIFFSLELYEAAFAWLIAMLVLIVITTVRFYKVNKLAGYLMIPYIAWVVFAGYLNAGVAFLN